MSFVRREQLQPGQPVVEMKAVSRRFFIRRERARSFQDKFIRLVSRRSVSSEEFWPLRDISLTIPQGESLGIIGPNGAGKSTMLKLITGIIVPTAGDLTINGRICSLLELGAGFQPDLTGRENIYLNGSIYGLSRAQMNQRIDAIIAFAELGDFIDTPVRHYSSGMYVRLGFAIAIHTDPDLLLVDEVLAVGDAAFQHKCLAAIQTFKDRGGTLLLVSHDLGAIQSVCSRAIWLEDGDIKAEGRPVDVVMRYLEHMAAKEEAQRQHAASHPAVAGDHRWGSGRVQIEQVELCGADGVVRRQFHTGEPMVVRLHYRCAERVAGPVFGLAFYDQSGVHITGPNTKFDGLEIGAVQGQGIVEYVIPRLPLLGGDYSMTAAAVSHNDSETYDYHDRLYRFRVLAGEVQERYGLITLAGRWCSAAAAEGQSEPAGQAAASAPPPEAMPERQREVQPT